MVIHIISVKYNGGLLPDIILFTQGACRRGFVVTAYETVHHYYGTMFDDVPPHCFCFVFAFRLMSLHDG